MMGHVKEVSKYISHLKWWKIVVIEVNMNINLRSLCFYKWLMLPATTQSETSCHILIVKYILTYVNTDKAGK